MVSPLILDDLRLCSVKDSATVRDVVANLDESSLRLALVVDSQGILLGIVSDGDIRRGLLAGRTLDDQATAVMNTRFTVAPASSPTDELRALARAREISHVPLVDLDGRPVQLYLERPEAVLSRQPNTVVIMAGGKGLRLRPLTETTPKPMLAVAGKPMVQHTLEALRAEGFRNFVMTLNYLAEQIEDYFGDGESFGVSISYVREDQPLGTAGALSLLEGPFVAPVIVVNGDLLLSAKIADMVAYHNQNGAGVTVGVKLLDTQIPFGVVEVDGSRVTGIAEKPVYRDFVNAGVYVLSPEILSDIVPGARLDMPDLVSRHIGAENVFAFPLHESWLDLGRIEDLEKARRDLEGNRD